MHTRRLLALLAIFTAAAGLAQKPAAVPQKEQMRMPWTRSNERFIRHWLVLTDIPATTPDAFEQDWLAGSGGETGIHPAEKMTQKLPGGSTVTWRSVTAWSDAADLSDGAALKRDLVGYAFTTIPRPASGKALLSIGSDESIRVWLNGARVLDRRTRRQLTFDEDQVEVDMKAGENTLLVKLEQRAGPWVFAARVLERGAIPHRIQEIGPSLIEDSPVLVIRSDINSERADQDPVTVQATAAGGKVLAEKVVPRGETVRFDPATWPAGAYEIRCATRRLNGLLYTTHIPWYKGDAVTAARELVAVAAKTDTRTPQGMIVRMLGDMIADRLGKDLGSVKGNPWWAIHSPLMEFEEIKLEASGQPARERPYGFFRLSWRDDIDDSPQFCRAYLPPGYDRLKKWPVVVRLHGYNPANPEYVRWWSADLRHSLADVEYSGRQGIIYIEPHGRGNTSYLGLGDQDVLRVIRLAKQQFSVDEERVYLAGDSMGGWGTWNVGTRHPDLFAAIAPIYGGVDYHSLLSEDELAKLPALDRFLQEKQSSWAMADGLLNLPVLVHHGDVDQSVNVDYSRYGVRMLQRWGYNVRYVEMPGYGHEDLGILPGVVDWFLQHRRIANPSRVRIRSAELQNATAYWVRVDQAASPAEFIVVDAELAAPNTIRVDSQNVTALTLAPGAGLVDASREVKVVWNGDARSGRLQGGAIRLRAPGTMEIPRYEKNAQVAGPLGDIFNTPFAIVTGTVAADPAMKDICARKAEAAANFWKQWQRQPPRVFKDTELSDQDAARYSLLLVGGADANAVARKLSAQLQVEISGEQVKIGGRSFAAPDSRVQAIFPNPLNPQRYVVLVAATSADGMFFWYPDRLRNTEFDFTIEDARMPPNQRVSAAGMWVAGGWFDSAWQVRDALVFPGDAELRSKSTVLHAPRPDRAIDPKILASYTGRYEVAPGIVLTLAVSQGRLVARQGEQPPVELLPVSETEFFVGEGPVKVVFEKDASGNVVLKAWQNGREFSGKKMQ